MSSLSFSIEPIYGSPWLAIVAAAAVIGVLIGVTPPTDNRHRRRTLMALRAAAGLLLVLVMFRPTLVRTDEEPSPATLIVAIDHSRSMTLPDGSSDGASGGPSRWATQLASAKQLSQSLASIADDRLNIQWLAYGKDPRTISGGADALDNREPSDDQTRIADAIRKTLASTEGQPVAGVVLMGDGTETIVFRQGDSGTADSDTAPLRSGSVRQAVASLDSLGIALWTVPIGPVTSQRRRDASIDALPESLSLFSGNRFDVPFVVGAVGMAGIEFNVRLTWVDVNGKSVAAASRRVVAKSADESLAMQVPVTVPPAGTYQLVVEAETAAGEIRVTNNRQVAFVDVREGGGRILYLEGSPRNEQSFLRRSIGQFPDLDLTYRWIPSDTHRSWPIDLGEAFEPGRFDVFILGDLPAAAIGESALRKLADRIREGAGLITLGGQQTYRAGGYSQSPIASLLPLRLPVETADIESPIKIRLARNHPITDLGGKDPVAAWANLPALPGADRLGELRSLPGATVLLESGQGDPLMAIAPAGRGRVVMSAMDSTWRWWRGGFDIAHRRFWRQTFLWALSRESDSDAMARLSMEKRRLELGEATSFVGELQTLADGNFEDQSGPAVNSLSVFLSTAQDEEKLISSATQSDRIEGSVGGANEKLPPGVYRLMLRGQVDGQPLDSVELPFQVVDRSPELDRPEADLALLRQVAAMTSDHGGRAYQPNEMKALAEQIRQDRRETVTPVVDRVRLGEGPWSGLSIYFLFATALSVEWYLRRRWNLV